jgi:hypothetical protein
LHKDEPTEIELRFYLDGFEYKYHLILSLNHVLLEAMYKKTSQQFSYIFIRERHDDGTYSVKKKDKDFPFKKSEAEKIKSNASLLSAASAYGVKEADYLMRFFRFISFNINMLGRVSFERSQLASTAKFLYHESELKTQVKEIIRELDLGLSDVEIIQYQPSPSEESTESEYLLFGVHKALQGEFKLSFHEESSGTQSAVVLLSRLLTVLAEGGVAVIDELDNDLHPHMLPKILDLFKFEHTNPHQAQLIFSCHTPEILDILQKHQVYLVEKKDLHSEAWRLDEVVGIRADDNLYAKYQAGALGAIPHL